MQNLFAFLTLSLLMGVAYFAQQTGMPTENFYALLIAMAGYVAYNLVKNYSQESIDE